MKAASSRAPALVITGLFLALSFTGCTAIGLFGSGPPVTWGPDQDGLRLGIAQLASAGEDGKAVRFRVAFQNTGTEDFVLCLGRMFDDDRHQYETQVKLVFDDGEGEITTYEHMACRRESAAGKEHHFFVALPAGCSYALRAELDEFVPTGGGDVGDAETVQALFEGIAIDRNTAGLDMRGAQHFPYWTGTIRSGVIDFDRP